MESDNIYGISKDNEESVPQEDEEDQDQVEEDQDQLISEEEFNGMHDLIEIIKNNPNGYISETELEWNLRELLSNDDDTAEILSKLPFEKAIQVRILLNGFIDQLKVMNLPPPTLNYPDNNNQNQQLQHTQLSDEQNPTTLSTLSAIFKKQTIIKNNKLNSIISNRNEINNLTVLNNQLNEEITNEKNQFNTIKLKYDKLLNDCINDQKVILSVNQQFIEFKSNVNSIIIEKNDELLKTKNQLNSITNENHKLKSIISKHNDNLKLIQSNQLSLINSELIQLQLHLKLKEKRINNLKQQLSTIINQQKEQQHQQYIPLNYEVFICLIIILLFSFTFINLIKSV